MVMAKLIVGVMGPDGPGIIARISRRLFTFGCNIEDVSQSTLQTEFSGTFIISAPDDQVVEDLQDQLRNDFPGFSVVVKEMAGAETSKPKEAQPYIITTSGADQMGLVAQISEIIAKHSINITNLRAVFRGGWNPRDNIMIYEVDVPDDTDIDAFRRELRSRGEDLALEVNIQHRRIFETINRI